MTYRYEYIFPSKGNRDLWVRQLASLRIQLLPYQDLMCAVASAACDAAYHDAPPPPAIPPPTPSHLWQGVGLQW